MILDIHTHRQTPYPEGLVNADIRDFNAVEGQYYSVGVHPWDTSGDITPEIMAKVNVLAQRPEILAIGECGIDVTKGGPMFRQLQIFKQHVDISESVGKPIILHAVKATDIIMGLKRDLNPSQQWIIHGFRGKPQTALMLLKAGIRVSFGPKFNPEAVAVMPEGTFYAETDDSIETIAEVISLLSEAANRDVLPEITTATSQVLRQDPLR